jgi:hypothetical protein
MNRLCGRCPFLVRYSILQQIFREMRRINARLDEIEVNQRHELPVSMKVSNSEIFLLPDHLRKTYLTVASKGECSATDVSVSTGRCRAVESNYLNQLVRQGWLSQRRVGKTVVFRVLREAVQLLTASA